MKGWKRYTHLVSKFKLARRRFDSAAIRAAPWIRHGYEESDKPYIAMLIDLVSQRKEGRLVHFQNEPRERHVDEYARFTLHHQADWFNHAAVTVHQVTNSLEALYRWRAHERPQVMDNSLHSIPLHPGNYTYVDLAKEAQSLAEDPVLHDLFSVTEKTRLASQLKDGWSHTDPDDELLCPVREWSQHAMWDLPESDDDSDDASETYSDRERTQATAATRSAALDAKAKSKDRTAPDMESEAESEDGSEDEPYPPAVVKSEEPLRAVYEWEGDDDSEEDEDNGPDDDLHVTDLLWDHLARHHPRKLLEVLARKESSSESDEAGVVKSEASEAEDLDEESEDEDGYDDLESDEDDNEEGHAWVRDCTCSECNDDAEEDVKPAIPAHPDLQFPDVPALLQKVRQRISEGKENLPAAPTREDEVEHHGTSSVATKKSCATGTSGTGITVASDSPRNVFGTQMLEAGADTSVAAGSSSSSVLGDTTADTTIDSSLATDFVRRLVDSTLKGDETIASGHPAQANLTRLFQDAKNAKTLPVPASRKRSVDWDNSSDDGYGSKRRRDSY